MCLIAISYRNIDIVLQSTLNSIKKKLYDIKFKFVINAVQGRVKKINILKAFLRGFKIILLTCLRTIKHNLRLKMSIYYIGNKQ